MILKDRNFSSCNYHSIPRFLQGQILFHLDNPDPNPVERKTISNPIQIQKNPNIRRDSTPKSGSCTSLEHTHSAERMSIKTDETTRNTRRWSRRNHRIADTFCSCIEDRTMGLQQRCAWTEFGIFWTRTGFRFA